MEAKTVTFLRSLLGVFIILGSMLATLAWKPGTDPFVYIHGHAWILIVLVVFWIVISLLFKKYHLGAKGDSRHILTSVIRINIIIASLTTMLMFALRQLELSRFVLFGTLITATILEIILFYAYKQITHSKKIDTTLAEYITIKSHSPDIQEQVIDSQDKITDIPFRAPKTVSSKLSSYIVEEAGKEVYNFIASHFDLTNDNFTILSTTTRFNVLKLPENCFCCIANLKRVNDIRFINKFFDAINQKIPDGGLYIGSVETKNMRKKRILRKYPPVLNLIFYFFDFIFKRLFPKFKMTKRFYFFLTRGQNRVLSKAETLGRLYSCGFEIEDVQHINGRMYFLAKKIRKPYNDPNPTYGPLVKLRRVGKNGKTFYVFKFRTMHPFSEYLQPYIYKHYDLKEGGKFKNDFRITTLGKFMRKFWIDELPMILNFIKGDMKLVGVRPLSQHYFNLYDRHVQELRIRFKPGLIPPFYVDMPVTLEEIQESEMKYLKAYAKHPFLTDWKYFWKAFYNIVFKKARSA